MNVDANIFYPIDNEGASQSLTMLRGRILAAFSKKIVGKFGQQFKSSSQSLAWFAKYNFFAAAENFQLFAPDGKFFGQPDRLAVS